MNKDIIFPVVYNLRVIYQGEANKGLERVTALLKVLKITTNESGEKPGGKGAFTRLGFNITLSSKSQMEALYSNLKTIPEIKWAT